MHRIIILLIATRLCNFVRYTEFGGFRYNYGARNVRITNEMHSVLSK